MTQLTVELFNAGIERLLNAINGSAAAVVVASTPDVVISQAPSGAVMTAKIAALLPKLDSRIRAMIEGGIYIHDSGSQDAQQANNIDRACNDAMFTLGRLESAAGAVPPVLSRWVPGCLWNGNDKGDALTGVVALAGPNGSYFAGVGVQQAYDAVLRQCNLLAQDMGRPGYGHDFGGAAALPGS